MIRWNKCWIGYDKAYGFYAKHNLGHQDSHIGLRGEVRHGAIRVETLEEATDMIRKYKEKQYPMARQLLQGQIAIIQKKIEELDKEQQCKTI